MIMDFIFRKFVFSVLAVILVSQVCSFSLPADVHRMEILDIDEPRFEKSHVNEWLANHEVLKLLRQLESSRGTQKLSSSPKLLHSFKWKNCGHSLSLLDLTELSVTPDPLRFPGDVFLQFAGTLKETVDAPLSLKVLLKKEITPAFWLNIPCIEGLGSCIYDDLCETLQGSSCPAPFVKYDVPCHCPFPKGSYKMMNSTFHATVNDVPAGNYYVKANASYGTKHVECVEVYFSVSIDPQ